MTGALVPFSELQKMAEAVASSGLFGVKTPEQALALMLVAQSEGLHPAIAARDYHVISGRAAMKADAMLARFQGAGGSVKWIDYMDAKVSAEFSHPQGGTRLIEWDVERAKRAGLSGRENWIKYPRQMLRARVISEGVRAVFPGCIGSMYVADEVIDQVAEKDMGDAEVVADPATAKETKKKGVDAFKAKVSQRDLVEESKPVVESGEDDLTEVLPTKEEKKKRASFKQKLSPQQLNHIKELLKDFNIPEDVLLKKAKVEKLGEIESENFDRSVTFLDNLAAAAAADKSQDQAGSQEPL